MTIMTETNIPPFLKKHLLRSWEIKNEERLNERKKQLIQYKITNGLDEENRPRGVKRKGGMGTDYNFGTDGQGEWQIIVSDPPEYKPLPAGKDFQMIDLLRELTTRQKFGVAASSEERETASSEEKGMYFLQSNWKVFSDILSNRSTNASLPCFAKVDLGDHGEADLIGIGADGRISVFEFIRGGGWKSQIEGYKQGIQQLFGLPEEMIQAYKVNCVPTSKGPTALVITPSGRTSSSPAS